MIDADVPDTGGTAIDTRTVPSCPIGGCVHSSPNGNLSPDVQLNISPAAILEICFPSPDITTTTGQFWDVKPPSTFPAMAGGGVGIAALAMDAITSADPLLAECLLEPLDASDTDVTRRAAATVRAAATLRLRRDTDMTNLLW